MDTLSRPPREGDRRGVKEKLCYVAFDYDTEADPYALRRKHHHCRRRMFPVARVFFQPVSLAFIPAESTTLLSTTS